MSGESGCCYPCIQCCYPDNSKDKFRHVQYKAPVDTNVTTASELDLQPCMFMYNHVACNGQL